MSGTHIVRASGSTTFALERYIVMPLGSIFFVSHSSQNLQLGIVKST
jgi:hypothetical protein